MYPLPFDPFSSDKARHLFEGILGSDSTLERAIKIEASVRLKVLRILATAVFKTPLISLKLRHDHE